MSAYKRLHRTRQHVFQGDTVALTAASDEINKNFRKHKHENDPAKLKELLAYADEVNNTLATEIVQAKVEDNTIAIKLRPEVDFHDKTLIAVNSRRRKRRERLEGNAADTTPVLDDKCS
ncbi:PREDICTED: complex III assembly factor LYRM7-like [Priapulus caudatus]|uniref:Complex III assembly factor LYRM7 n=1 Tax=Priapulus caudatus TaxID=37621 RepID=A0ABM1EUH5_PRICU|nr:PREDICTED: complex III assembly factor LYRM7-like [Priapulus caudatus]